MKTNKELLLSFESEMKVADIDGILEDLLLLPGLGSDELHHGTRSFALELLSALAADLPQLAPVVDLRLNGNHVLADVELVLQVQVLEELHHPEGVTLAVGKVCLLASSSRVCIVFSHQWLLRQLLRQLRLRQVSSSAAAGLVFGCD